MNRSAPKATSVDSAGNIVVVDTENHAIRRIDAANWTVTTIASGLAQPQGSVIVPNGGVLVAGSDHRRVVWAVEA